MSNEFQIRPYRPGDDQGLAALFAAAFGRATRVAHQRWKLHRRPSPVANVWLAVDRDQRPLCQYAGIPRRLLTPAGARPVMVAVDGMTHPDHRRRGLLTTVVRAAHEAYREAGVAAVLGLPNEQWGSRIAALDWRPLFPLRWRLRPLRPGALLRHRLGRSIPARPGALDGLWNTLANARLPGAGEIEIEHLADAGPRLDPIADAAVAALGSRPRSSCLALDRGSEWIAWRYLACPDARYRLLLARRDGRPVGYLVYRHDRDAPLPVAYLAELVAPVADRAARTALLRACLEDARGDGAAALAALAPPRTPLDRELRRASFLRRRGVFGVHLVPLAGDLPWAELADPERWQLHGGDFDVV